MHGPATERAVVPRGIWKAPYLQDGHPVVIAVDSHSRRVALVVMLPELTPADVRRTLTLILDTVDPVPQLRLMSRTPDMPPSERGEPRQLSPASYLLLSRHRA